VDKICIARYIKPLIEPAVSLNYWSPTLSACARTLPPGALGMRTRRIRAAVLARQAGRWDCSVGSLPSRFAGA